MVIGHSLGGFQTVRVLHQLAGNLSNEVPVWNPVTRKEEDRCAIFDPTTREPRTVIGLELSHAVALGAGGLTRVLPNTWTLTGRLRDIPDSVDAFTGYYIPLDHIRKQWVLELQRVIRAERNESLSELPHRKETSSQTLSQTA